MAGHQHLPRDLGVIGHQLESRLAEVGYTQYTSHEYLILIYEEILTYSDITETQTYVDSETVTLVYQ